MSPQNSNLVLETKLQPSEFFLASAGIEAVLKFEEKCDFPDFSAFVLLQNKDSIETLKRVWERYIEIGKSYSSCKGYILETPTWRASSDWASKVGISNEELRRLNALAIQTALNLKNKLEEKGKFQIVVSGLLGPRYEGFKPKKTMTAEEAEEYHLEQIKTFAQCGADMVSLAIATSVTEAIGFVKAAQESMISVEIGFTVETDGNLPDGTTLKQAIETVDKRTNKGPSYYMINCAHIDHFQGLFTNLDPSGDNQWLTRLKDIRSNSSRQSHEELDSCSDLQPGGPEEFGKLNFELKKILPDLRVVGGCCGTGDGHLKHVCSALQNI